MIKWTFGLLILSICSITFAAPKVTEAEYRQHCQDLLTGKKASNWASEEADYIAQIPMFDLRFLGGEPQLSALQKTAMGIDPKLTVEHESLEIRFNASSTSLQIQSRIGNKEVGLQTLNWDSVKYGFMDFSKYAAMEINSFGTSIASEVRAGLILLLTKKVGNVELGFGFKSNYRQAKKGYGDPSTVKGLNLQIFVVRECKRQLGGQGDFLFPVKGTDPQSKNLCLTPIGSLQPPPEPEPEDFYSSWPVTG